MILASVRAFLGLDRHKVFLQVEDMEVSYIEHFARLKVSDRVDEWLSEHRGEYKLCYNSRTGARWIEFKNQKTAILCKLSLG